MQVNNLAELLSVVVQLYPDNIAIKDSKRSYTYGQLYDDALRIAQVFVQHGVEPRDRVVVISKKNTESLLVFWAVVFCEAIPVMLDHEDGLPANIIKAREVKPKAVILDALNVPTVPDVGCEKVLDFTEVWMSVQENIRIVPKSSAGADDVCYILLTSGTTGKSKAVQITHGNVLHYAYAIHAKLGNPEKVNAVHASTFAADLGLTNLLVALVSGGMLRVLDKNEATDPAIFHDIIAQDHISLVKITSSHLLALIAHLKAPYRNPIDHVVLGGEKLSWETIRILFSLGICTNLYNHYGPTEATIGAIAFKIGADSKHFDATGSVPLGTPLGNGYCFLDNPVDGIGELYITGPGISTGYFENEAENGKKFFIKEIKGKQLWCYRTGDVCRKLDDGNYEFLYRTDRQVKVKGYRIELGEIELAISAYPGIENVIVCVSDTREHNIEAYIKIPKGLQIGKELRNWLSTRLAAWKIPADFYFYTEAPYNSNGKIDLNALKKQVKKTTSVHPLPGDNGHGDSWPELVEATWKLVLSKDEIAQSDNFFEIGGDSLLAIQLTGRLQRHGYKIHISDLNNNSTFGDFILLDPERLTDIQVPVNKNDSRRLTFSQQQFLRRNNFDQNAYCQAILLQTENKIQIREMVLAVHYVMESHAELTKPFKKNAGNHQAVANRFSSRNVDVTVINNNKPVSVQIQETCSQLMTRIAIEKGCLFLVNLFIDPGGDDYIYLLCHHLCVDVVSWNIIIDELCEYYDRLLKNEQVLITRENTVDHFFDELSGKVFSNEIPGVISDPEMYRLPVSDNNYAPVKPIEVSHIVVPEGLSLILRNMQEQGKAASLCGFLLSALGNAVLQEFAVPEITIDMEFHGRPQHKELPDLSRSVAWWATTWPVHIEAGKSDPAACADLIQKIGLVANELNLLYDQFARSTTSYADIRFNYLGVFPEFLGNDSLRLQPAYFNAGPTRTNRALDEYKLNFTARFIGKLLRIDVQYHLNILSAERIHNIISRFFKLLKNSLNGRDTGSEAIRLPFVISNMPSVGQPLYNLRMKAGKPRGKKTVFLTGATGFLGIHLLHELCNNEAVEIYCLVRGKDHQHAVHRLESVYRYFFNEWPEERMHRIRVIKGDLLAEHFGIPAASYEEIANNTDVILHAAADTNLLKSYKELMPANILATQHVIELAEAGKNKALHYISTLAVSGGVPNGIDKDFSEDDFNYGQFFISDYERTKFDAENMVRAFSRKGGTASIYRVGHIAADSQYGKFQQNIHHNRVFQLIKGMICLKKIPNVYNELVSFSYVDVVAKGISHFCLEGADHQPDCLHIDSSYYYSFVQIADLLRQLGYDIDIVNMPAYKSAIAGLGSTAVDKRSIDLMDTWIQRSVDFPRKVNYINKKTLDLMAEAGLYFPDINVEWFSRMLQEGVNAGYFPTASDANQLSCFTKA
ncbi:hypothetical protein A4H97_22290 [Niastella yeongjuensis]|uniref:Carrier domain-containing protein n=1 Tax=Niastella yeongjuensis TaxID=354355 RepID=A0A1V9F731_9BACT|nr:SDR family oxidoreductase [Niastella yeongjuensis]OQP54230.1 hypothetical protein A4H97_22290 [Niastella yeongjuensis]SEP31609.1 thioester reductase domain-containing protein [Niastella yeongjuensis]